MRDSVCGIRDKPLHGEEPFRMQTIDNWLEWKEKCALALCGEDTRRLLPGFVHARFSRHVEAYVRTTNAGSASGVTPSAGDAWHRFETHFQLHSQPGGKAYKDWLFARLEEKGYSAQESIEAGATLLLRDVVREYLRREYSSHMMVSANARLGGDVREGAGPSLEELLPGTMDTIGEVEDRDLEDMARADSPAAFARLDRRERIALLVHQAGMSLAHPEAMNAAGCGRNALNDAFHSALAGIAAYAREKHQREDRSVQASLACLTYEKVRHLVFRWGKSENGCAHFCRLIETQERVANGEQ
jgi:hypothetical protein